MPDLKDIRSALRRVVDPCSIATGNPIDLFDMGLVKDVSETEGEVEVVLRLTSPICWQASNIIAKTEEVVGAVPGVRSVRCTIDASAEWMPDMMAATARTALRRLRTPKTIS